jgi:membrane-bound serine protease (ClpP class)
MSTREAAKNRARSTTAHGTRAVRAFFAAALIALGVGIASAPAAARGGDDNQILVVQVEGLLDPPNATLVRDAIERANDSTNTTMVILQIDSGGAVDIDLAPILDAIDESTVPIVAWVGPSGAEAEGAATVLVEAAHVATVATDTSLGPASPLRLDDPGSPPEAEVAALLVALAEARDRNPEIARQMATERVGASELGDAATGIGIRPTLGDVIVALDGETVETAAGPVELSTARVVGEGVDRRREPNQDVLFDRLGLQDQVLHTLISPSIAYLLLVAGLALIVFEFFTVSIGIAGITGGVAVVGAFIGFSHLPVTWWAVALLLLAMFGFAVDVQAGRLGPWTGIGLAALVAASLTLYGGSSRLNVPWWVILLVVLGTLLFMVGGMTAVIRARFSTPTVGREGMVGATGEAEVDVAPDGVVVIDGARWRARTNRATPIKAGEPVRVVAVEGLLLEVEPPTGGARDYREAYRERRGRK